MNECVSKIEEVKFKNGIFDDIIDCTYVVLCCGDNPKRLESVRKQLNVLRPSKLVKLVYNNGYKNCDLTSSPNLDLVMIQKYIFENAIENLYERILFLEDDFELKKVIEPQDVKNIIKFVEEKDPDVYSLGSMAYPTPSTIFSKNQKLIANHIQACHSVFFNYYYMDKFIEHIDSVDKENLDDLHIDILVSKIDNIDAYRYWKPLIYQKAPATENQKIGWQKINYIGTILVVELIKLVKLDTQLEPGWTLIYVFPYVLYTIIIFLVICLIYFLTKNVKNLSKNNSIY